MSSITDGLAANRDLVAVYALAVAAVVASELGETGTIWFPLAILLLFVLPGYVTTAFAYAGSGGGPAASGQTGWTLVSLTERLAFSLGGSLAILPILAILTYLSPLQLTPSSLVIGVSGYVLVGAVAVGIRRRRLSETSRWKTRSGAAEANGTWASTVQAVRRLSLLNVVLAVSVVFAVSTLGVAIAVPSHGETTTDLHLLTEQNGRLVVDGYPDTLTEGESAPLTVGVTNEEHRPAEYTVVAELQRVQTEGRSVVVVVDKQSVGRYGFGLEHGESWRQQLDVQGSMTGENLRFAVYLYRGDAPATPTADSAYRTTYIWLDVQPSGSESK
jgi:uncharacterized membrane protein